MVLRRRAFFVPSPKCQALVLECQAPGWFGKLLKEVLGWIFMGGA
jgi:hypothetical protein